MAHLIFTTLVLMGQICGVLAHLAYMLKFGLTDLKGFIFAFMCAAGFCVILYATITVFIFRSEICAILDQLSSIYLMRKH